MILVDSNVLLDLLGADPHWSDWSRTQLEAAAIAESLCVNPIVYAEIAGDFASDAAVDAFLREARLTVEPFSLDVCFRAGQARRRYRANRGEKLRILPDFLIGAHAEIEGWTILTRDPRPYRTYLSDVPLITP